MNISTENASPIDRLREDQTVTQYVVRDMSASERPVRVVLFGAAPDTANMGVSALFHAAVAALHQQLPGISITAFDNQLGRREQAVRLSDKESIGVEMRGVRPGKRYDRAENLTTMLILSKLGRLGTSFNSNLRAIDAADAVLDVSGGDSFSDLYGRKRFFSVIRPKWIALQRDKPLILLPQTYGPFNDPASRRMAADVVRRAAMCWARDERSFDVLQDLLGDAFDPDRHRCGVDLAFALQPHNARDAISPELQSMLAADRSERPLVGFNVSGLIYHDPAKAVSRYKFKADYRKLLELFLSGLLETTAANLVLIPHVMSAPGHYESDPGACEAVASILRDKYADRVLVSPRMFDQRQVKWLIGQSDWFCGTRMHSTIAALSSGVPTATVSYSDKAKGVFESCGQGAHVIDPCKLDTGEVIERLKASFESRADAKALLANRLPAVKTKAAEQLDAGADRIRAAHARRKTQQAG